MNLIDSSILTLLFHFGMVGPLSLCTDGCIWKAYAVACLFGGIGMSVQIWGWRYMLRALSVG